MVRPDLRSQTRSRGFWAVANLQAAALLAVAVPAAVASLAGSRAAGALSIVVAVAAASGVVAYSWAGSSARGRRRFGRSLRGLAIAGAVLDVLGLLLMAAAPLAAVGALSAGSGVAGFGGRAPPARLVLAAAVPMVLAACGVAALPREDAVLTLAVVFGLGYGAVRAAVAEPLRDALPDGVTGGVRALATPGIPGGIAGVLAPLLGGWLLTHAGPAAGYRALFLVAGGCVAAGAVCAASRRWTTCWPTRRAPWPRPNGRCGCSRRRLPGRGRAAPARELR